VDGEVEAVSASKLQAVATSPGIDVRIGNNQFNDFLAGQLDQLLIYDQPLTANDIAYLALGPGPLDAWFFEGTGADDGPGGHALSLLGGATYSGIARQGGGSLDLSTSGAHAEAVGYKGLTGSGARTLSAWIKTSGTGVVAAWGAANSGEKFTVRVQDDNGTAGAIRAEVHGGYIVGSTDLRDDQWHHVAVVLVDDGSPEITEALLYVDGALESVSAGKAQPVDTAAGIDLLIGKDHYGNPFSGLLDEIAVFDKALSPLQIQILSTP